MAGKAEHTKLYVANIGAACTGKSTQTKLSQERFAPIQNILVLEDEALKYLTEHAEKIKGPVHIYEHQKIILQHKLDSLRRAGRKPGINLIITDGSPLDTYVLTKYFSGDQEAQPLLRPVSHSTKNTVYILHHPEGIPFENDGIRTERDSDRNPIHETYVELLNQLGLYYVIATGSIGERAEQINDEIEKQCRKRNIIFEAKTTASYAIHDQSRHYTTGSCEYNYKSDRGINEDTIPKIH